MKICFVAQFPPPIHGLSIAVDTLYKALDSDYELEKINLVGNRQFIGNCLHILRSSADFFYLTISQSRMGNLRDLVLLWLISCKRKKTVIHLHGGYYRELIDNDIPKWQRRKNLKALARVDRAIVLSESFRRIFKGIVADEKIEVVPNFFEESINSSGGARNENGGKKRILYLSNMIESKGYKEVLKLAILEKDRHYGYHFDFAGAFFDNRLKDEFERIIEENELCDIVSYHGIVGGEKKQALLRKSDIFILLTRYPKEGQPISIIEAMANGLAIVATDHAAIPDMIIDGENGILVSKGMSIEQIFDSIQNLDIEQISKRNIEKACSLFSKDKYVNNMVDAFNKVLIKE